MVVADLNIIPSRPSMFDLWASAKTRAALKDVGGDFVFLLNQCPPAQQTARVQDGVETLEEMGGLISPLILARVDYQEAVRHGWGVTELNPNGAAAEEMRGLWASIRRRLAARRRELNAGILPLANYGRALLPGRPASFLDGP
jgi:chromosome partitioning protein